MKSSDDELELPKQIFNGTASQSPPPEQTPQATPGTSLTPNVTPVPNLSTQYADVAAYNEEQEQDLQSHEL